MKKSKVYIIVILVLAAVAIYLVLSQNSGTIGKRMKAFAIEDTASVTRIFMADKRDRQVDLKRKEDGQWILNGTYPARKENVDMLLKTMLNIEVREPVSRAAYNTVISNLAANGVKVEIYQHKYRIDLFGAIRLLPVEKRTRTYYVGSATQDNQGTYMMIEGSDEPFIVYLPGFRGFVSVRYSVREDDWRDHTVFASKVMDINSFKLDFLKNPEESYVIEKVDSNLYSLHIPAAGQEMIPYDTLKMLNFFSSFRNLRFETLLNQYGQQYIDSVTAEGPFAVMTLALRNGEEVSAKIYLKKAEENETDIEGNPVQYDRDRFFMHVRNDSDFVLAQYFVFDRILKPAGYFIN